MRRTLLSFILVLGFAFGQQEADILATAQADLTSGKLTQSIKGFEAVIAGDYNNYEAHLGLGLAQYRSGNFSGAAFEFAQLTTLNAERFEGWFNLAIAQSRQGDTDNAGKNFSKSIEIGEKTPLESSSLRDAYVGQAEMLRLQGKHPEANTALKSALAKFPGDIELTSMLSDSMVQAGQSVEALPLLADVVSRDPANIRALVQMADVYVAEGQKDKALNVLDGGLRNITRYQDRILLMLKKAKLVDGKQRKQLYIDAIKLDPNHVEAQYGLGSIKLQEGDYKGALQAYKAAYAKDSSNPNIQLALAFTYDSLKDYKNSGKFADLCAPKLTGAAQTQAYLLVGESRYSLKNYKGAVSAFSKVTQLEPTNAVAWYNLGISYAALKKDAEARAALTKAADLGYAPAQELLK